ncbi:helix-turn-helix domain-containing protein [Breoghania sp.]|uniref:helix-turn-helix domain-containing protein n=1 Tax=Breoghania sp. TaxID=2065378 RepID=UPI0029CA8109|nr:helix-turn-helix domain-containing protein [Breoghania sp.]
MNNRPADYSYLPDILAQIAGTAGLDAALKLAAERGGQTVYIPSHATPGHWLTDIVGLQAAIKICDHFRVRNSGARLLIPIARKSSAQRTLVKALENGASAREAAAAAGVHERTAFRARRRLKSKQGELF